MRGFFVAAVLAVCSMAFTVDSADAFGGRGLFRRRARVVQVVPVRRQVVFQQQFVVRSRQIAPVVQRIEIVQPVQHVVQPVVQPVFVEQVRTSGCAAFFSH